MRSEWKINTTNKITVVVDANVQLVARIYKVGSSSDPAIFTGFVKTGEIYSLDHSFSDPGTYVINVVDLNGIMRKSVAVVDAVVETMLEKSEAVADVVTGSRDLDPETNTLTHYSRIDPLTPSVVFDTTDQYDNPTTESVYKATRK